MYSVYWARYWHATVKCQSRAVIKRLRRRAGSASHPSSRSHFPLQLVTTFQIFCLDRIQPLSYQSTQQRACWYWVMCAAWAADDVQLGACGRATWCLWVKNKCTITTLLPTSSIKHCFHPNVSEKSARKTANHREFPLHIGMWVHCIGCNKIAYYDRQTQTLVGLWLKSNWTEFVLLEKTNKKKTPQKPNANQGSNCMWLLITPNW